MTASKEFERLVKAKFVVVADVPVAFWNVKFCKVVEPFAKNCWNDETSVVEVAMNAGAIGAFIATKLVVVAFVVVEFVTFKPKIVARVEEKVSMVPVIA